MPPGRLVRLGVAARSLPGDEVVSIAVLCERAGLDTFWMLDGSGTAASVFEILAEAAERTTSIVLGAFLPEPPAAVPEALHGRLEITVPAGRLSLPPAGVRRISRLVRSTGDLPAARSPGVDLFVITEASGLPGVAANEHRHPALGLVTGCIIGRTSAEVLARRAADPSHGPAGLVGTLEECQQQLLALARRGVIDVRCILPRTADVHDLIAQLPAMATGSLGALSDQPRSPDSAPPAGWGRRRHRPEGQNAGPCPV